MYIIVGFKNEPGYDFSVQKNVGMFKETLRDVGKELGQDIPLVINEEKIFKDDKIKSIDPADASQVVANVSEAAKQDVEDAFKATSEAYKSWKTWSANDRIELMLCVPAAIRHRKVEIAAIMAYEVGKPRDEAVDDTTRGIDFIEYYTRSMMNLAQGKPVLDREGGHNKYFYRPIGTSVIIPPWNFPFAIMAGTTLAPIVAGNTMLSKPTEGTPCIAYKLMEVLGETELPKGVVNFVPGDPKEIDGYLVDHKDAHFVMFTGSRVAGTRIYEHSAVAQEGQNFLKRVIAEMGGKSAIVVDENIGTDMAAEAIVTSAFGFSGQEYSACSRTIVHKDVYDEILEKSIRPTKELTLGNTVDDIYMGPVINKKQFDKIKSYIEIGKEEGRLEQGSGTNDSKGYFVEPTIISGLKSKDRIIQGEIFGPVVGFVKVNDFGEAIEVTNDTDHGLTGAVITNNREHWIKAVDEFDVGNLYLGRGRISAVVGYHPFSGFKMSGTDTKTGNPNYLLHFLEQKVVSEMF